MSGYTARDSKINRKQKLSWLEGGLPIFPHVLHDSFRTKRVTGNRDRLRCRSCFLTWAAKTAGTLQAKDKIALQCEYFLLAQFLERLIGQQTLHSILIYKEQACSMKPPYNSWSSIARVGHILLCIWSEKPQDLRKFAELIIVRKQTQDLWCQPYVVHHVS